MSLNLNPDTFLLIYILVLDGGKDQVSSFEMKFYCISVDKYVPSSAAARSEYIYTQHLQQQALGRACFAWNSSFNLLMEVQ